MERGDHGQGGRQQQDPVEAPRQPDGQAPAEHGAVPPRPAFAGSSPKSRDTVVQLLSRRPAGARGARPASAGSARGPPGSRSSAVRPRPSRPASTVPASTVGRWADLPQAHDRHQDRPQGHPHQQREEDQRREVRHRDHGRLGHQHGRKPGTRAATGQRPSSEIAPRWWRARRPSSRLPGSPYPHAKSTRPWRTVAGRNRGRPGVAASLPKTASNGGSGSTGCKEFGEFSCDSIDRTEKRISLKDSAVGRTARGKPGV